MLTVRSLFFASGRVFYLLFYFEVRVIPMLCLVLGWGVQPERLQAAIYMIIYTVCGSLPIFIALCWLVSLIGTDAMSVLVFISWENSLISENLMVGILVSPILVKMPIYFLHRWLPKAHVEAPVRGSMILAGVILKIGLFGLCRIVNMFGVLSDWMVRVFMSVSMVGGLVCGINCFCRYDVKVIIAYSSISHMGLCMAGVLRGLPIGWAGGLRMGLAHGICSPCLFMMGGFIYRICGSRRVLLCKGVLVGVPVLRGLWFSYCCLNLCVPPSLGFFSEILIYCSVIRVITCWGAMFLGAIRVAGGRYRVVLYGSIGHGSKRSLLYRGSGMSLRCICCRFLGVPFLIASRLYLDLFFN
jgi:NADH-ubiquinone oxidoreductase chain 4